LGKLIGIWAPYKGAGCTTITLAVSYKMAEMLDKNKKILVCCANGSNSTLIKTIGISSEELGLEDLVSYRLAGFAACEYEAMLARRGRIFFAGSSKLTPIFLRTYAAEFDNVFDELRRKFDICIVDLPYGKEDILGNAILSRCDTVITILEQDISNLSQNIIFPGYVNESVIIVNKYKEVLPEIQDIKNIYNINQDICGVPYCSILPEMWNKRKIIQYFSLKTDFCTKIENTVSNILDLKNNECYIPRPADTDRKLLRRLKVNFVGGQQ